jgi:predicted CXXCH cytochrome family protein
MQGTAFMSTLSTKARWLLGLLAVTAAAGIGFALWRHQQPSVDPTAEHSSFPVPPYSASKYLNTGPEARYVGIAVCAECHPKRHQSYLLTPHSRALSDIDPKAEPPDGSFVHKATGRSYRVYRRDGQFRHEEVVRTPGGEELARVDVPIRYLIGSGHFTRSYIVEIDGFLHESPITWYTSRNKWDMSPGYDSPRHMGFERAVKIGCLACHAGRVEPADNTVHRMTIHEQVIGCENCHGPGAQHEALHRSRKHVAGTEDLTIVNPSKLSRSLLESICAVCHLSGPASILLRGRKATDYRPGMPLTDYRIDYRFDSGNEQMTVVGHIEQLRQSACYQKSENLTCLSCHDPHASEKPKDRVAFYRQKCLDCHAEKGCKLEKVERLKKEPADICVACHMPHGNTEIPHISFTHHRIGRHAKQTPIELDRVPRLVPTEDGSHLSALEQKRNLGLAYFAASQKGGLYPGYVSVFRERARVLLETVRAEGLREGETSLGLAHIYFARQESKQASAWAREAVEAKDSSPDVRSVALTLLASWQMQENNFDSASELLKELTRLRHSSHDWRMLGVCYLKLNQPQRALEPLSKALAIRPYHPATHANFVQLYRQLGNPARAAEHLHKQHWLERNNQE